MLNKSVSQIFPDYSCKTYVINLDSRPDRWVGIQESFAAIGEVSELHRISACTSSIADNNVINGRIGCLLSHRKAISLASEKGLDCVFVLEDDVDFEEKSFGIFKTTVENLSFKDWKILYLGCESDGPLLYIEQNLYKLSRPKQTHAMVYHKSCYNELLEVLPSNEEDALKFISYYKAIDTYYANFYCPLNSVYAIYPNIAKQKDGWSDIGNKESKGTRDINKERVTESAFTWFLWRLKWMVVERFFYSFLAKINPLRKKDLYRKKNG